MISREQVEMILKINGMTSSSPDEHIRSVLLSARYNHDEVDTALMILREDLKTKQTRVDGIHKIFRSDDTLKPKEISKLLGIEVDASQFVEIEQKQRDYAMLQYIVVWFFSVAFAVTGILLYMYMNQVGMFHPSVNPESTNVISNS